ncbi:MAG: alpha-amylase family glycosyl hydrolase [Calditrichia bacterium]
MRLIYALIICFTVSLVAQPVTTVPQFATQNDSIKIIFDATEGDGGLAGFNGTIYAHTGVITSESNGSWTNVIGNWGDNNAQPTLTKIGTDLYELVIGNPRQFYSITNANEQILQIAFVFRNANKTRTGRDVGGADIFANLFESGLNVLLVEPNAPVLYEDPRRSPYFTTSNEIVDVKVAAAAIGSELTSLTLYVNNTQVAQTVEDSLLYQLDTSTLTSGFTELSAIGIDTSGASDTSAFVIMVRDNPVEADPPAGTIPGINYNNSTSVTLALIAPYKDFVYAVGDFNDWLVDNAYYMNRKFYSSDSVMWWVTIDNLTSQQEYAFQYLVDGEIRIADPYTEKVLDQWNDQFIPSVTYPNLKPYPFNKTDQPTGVIQTDQQPYQWQTTNYQRPAQDELVIYELLVRDFIARHDYETMIDTLDYLENLGVNAIELMPFNEFEGNNSWGYNTSFMFAVDKYYGTADKLKAFIDECHNRGIAIIMDIVLNHNYGQSPLVRLYFDGSNDQPTPSNPWFNTVSPNPVFSFGYDFDHESRHTKAFVDRVNKFWIEEFRIDGFRFDFTKGFTNTPGDGGARDNARIAILKRMADKVWDVDPESYVILEHFADNSEEKELAEYGNGMLIWGNHNFNYSEAAMGYHGNGGGDSDFSWGYYGTRGWSKAHLVTYMESHDEERLMYKNLEFGNSSGNYSVKDFETALNREKLAAAFFFTIPGPKLIWQFGEVGYDFSIDFNGRVGEKPIRWDYFRDTNRNRLYRTYAALINLRRDQEVFHSPSTQVDLALRNSNGRKRISLSHPTMDVTIVGNFGVTQQPVAGQFSRNGQWYDYFSGDSIEVFFPTQTVDLAPGEFKLLTSVRLDPPEPDLLTGIEELSAEIPQGFKLKQNYPNPFNPETTIEFQIESASDIELTIYNIAGQKVRTLASGSLAPGTYRTVWDGLNDADTQVASGIYLLRLKAGNEVRHRRMVLLK